MTIALALKSIRLKTTRRGITLVYSKYAYIATNNAIIQKVAPAHTTENTPYIGWMVTVLSRFMP